jgi:hypothetical protein
MSSTEEFQETLFKDAATLPSTACRRRCVLLWQFLPRLALARASTTLPLARAPQVPRRHAVGARHEVEGVAAGAAHGRGGPRECARRSRPRGRWERRAASPAAGRRAPRLLRSAPPAALTPPLPFLPPLLFCAQVRLVRERFMLLKSCVMAGKDDVKVREERLRLARAVAECGGASPLFRAAPICPPSSPPLRLRPRLPRPPQVPYLYQLGATPAAVPAHH